MICPNSKLKKSIFIMQQRWSRGHKARGQGQGHKKNPRPRPRTAFPRTDPLEAKDRNARGQGQGPRTQPQVFSKKKRSSKKFFRQFPIYRRSQNFWLGRIKPQITCNDVIKNLPVFHLTRILQRDRASTNIVEKCKYVILETFWKKQCNLNVSQKGVWGRSSQLLSDFL